MTPSGLELVTLTEDRAVLTWYTGATGSTDELGRSEPAPADAEVRWGTDPARLDRTASSDRTDTPYHRVELTGLEPGRTYHYEARSGGAVAEPTPFSMIDGNAVSTVAGPAGDGPHAFTVPQPPPGRFLFSVVLCNDFHFGETVAGRSGDIAALAGVSQVPGHPPYPEVMFESLVEDAAALGADFLLAAGDITAEAEPVDLATARRLLDGFGGRNREWFLTRGNHDRAHDGDAWASCRVGRWGGHDCFVDEFFPDDEPTYFSTEVAGLRVIGIDTYDRAGKGSEAGELSPEQLAWFQETVAASADQPTLVFGHHPLVVEASPYPSPPSSALDADQAAEIQALYRANPGVFLHHAGHTHRNHRSALAGAPGVVHQEVAAVKEYPGGFTLLRVHEGGYALNFHKSSSDEARAWSERSRTQIGGTWPQFSLGSRVADRNAVVERDLSGLQAIAASTATTRATSPSAGAAASSSNDGPSPAILAGAGLAVVAAGAGGVLALRRRREADGADADATAPAGPADPADRVDTPG
ncbi:MAG: metallophosphoesterase [Ilumatobacteraceae bacterium]|nr:metallophosphoesterase [Ilumatobacteraceae bacterium]